MYGRKMYFKCCVIITWLYLTNKRYGKILYDLKEYIIIHQTMTINQHFLKNDL